MANWNGVTCPGVAILVDLDGLSRCQFEQTSLSKSTPPYEC